MAPVASVAKGPGDIIDRRLCTGYGWPEASFRGQ